MSDSKDSAMAFGHYVREFQRLHSRVRGSLGCRHIKESVGIDRILEPSCDRCHARLIVVVFRPIRRATETRISAKAGLQVRSKYF